MLYSLSSVINQIVKGLKVLDVENEVQSRQMEINCVWFYSISIERNRETTRKTR